MRPLDGPLLVVVLVAIAPTRTPVDTEERSEEEAVNRGLRPARLVEPRVIPHGSPLAPPAPPRETETGLPGRTMRRRPPVSARVRGGVRPHGAGETDSAVLGSLPAGIRIGPGLGRVTPSQVVPVPRRPPLRVGAGRVIRLGRSGRLEAARRMRRHRAPHEAIEVIGPTARAPTDTAEIPATGEVLPDGRDGVVLPAPRPADAELRAPPPRRDVGGCTAPPPRGAGVVVATSISSLLAPLPSRTSSPTPLWLGARAVPASSGLVAPRDTSRRSPLAVVRRARPESGEPRLGFTPRGETVV